jgi:hypothetical protein
MGGGMSCCTSDSIVSLYCIVTALQHCNCVSRAVLCAAEQLNGKGKMADVITPYLTYTLKGHKETINML